MVDVLGVAGGKFSSSPDVVGRMSSLDVGADGAVPALKTYTPDATEETSLMLLSAAVSRSIVARSSSFSMLSEATISATVPVGPSLRTVDLP